MGVRSRFASTCTMSFESTTQKLDGLISRLENELGERSVPINPDDPWASFRLKTFSVSPVLQVKSCSDCSYKLTLPFETKCPSCGFKGEQQEAFPLLTVEQMLASLPEPVPAAPAASKSKKKEQKAAPQQKAPQQPKKENSNNGGSSNNAAAPPSESEILEGWNKCAVQVSKIASVENHPTADQLYVLQLDVGADKPRQVCAGLKKYYETDKLVDRLVCTMMNLKPKKLRGVASTAMVLAGSEGDQVRIVDPPQGSAVGDVLYLDGTEPNT